MWGSVCRAWWFGGPRCGMSVNARRIGLTRGQEGMGRVDPKVSLRVTSPLLLMEAVNGGGCVCTRYSMRGRARVIAPPISLPDS